MATRLHVGAKELKGDLAAYAKRFDLLEVRGADAAHLKQAPSAATLRRWRRAAPPQFEFSVVAGPNVGKLKPGPAFDAELAAMLEAVEILRARVMVLPTPSDVTPSKLWRDRVAKVLEKLPRDASSIVWEPSGLWENEDAAEQAAKWDVVLGVDPARDPMPKGPVAYGRLRAAGGTRAFSTAALQKIADTIGERRDAYVLIETASALKEAKTLRGLVRQLASGGKKGGLGRLIRPKGAALEGLDDDEQEEE
ncbi:MAG: DUF72 domain-containing protein [Deltaproteobacteria bacterium]|nr:DUF72 domain-containing protein [Deltaproteobacteria bacterium]